MELGGQEHAELVACRLEDTGTGGGVARQQDGLQSVCMSSSVFPLGTDGAEWCRCALQSRDRKDQGRAEGAESQHTGLHGLKSHHRSPVHWQAHLDPAGLTGAPYLPCVQAGQASVTNALAQSLRPKWGCHLRPLPDQLSQTFRHDPGLRTERAREGHMPSLKPVP